MKRLFTTGTTLDLEQIIGDKLNQLDPNNDLYYDNGSGFMLGKGTPPAESAMREATVFSCVRILSDGIAQMDLNLFNEDEEGNKSPAKGNPLYALLKHKPCTWMSGYDYWKWNMVNLCLRGFFLSRKVYSENGKVVTLIPYHPDYTEFEQRADGGYRFKSVSVVNVSRKQLRAVDTIEQEDAYYCMYATLDGFTPVSPIKYAAESIRAAGDMRKHGHRTFENFAVPSGVLTVPEKLSDPAFKNLRESWNSTYGSKNVGKVAILEEGTKFEQMSMSNEDSQYLETRRYTREEIAAIFGVPPYMVGDTSQATGWSTLEAQSSDLLRWTFNPWIKRIEDATTVSFVPRSRWGLTYARFDTFELTRGNIVDRTSFYASGIEHGYLSPNEVRHAENLNARDGGDEYLTPMNMNSTSDTESDVEREPEEQEADDAEE